MSNLINLTGWSWILGVVGLGVALFIYNYVKRQDPGTKAMVDLADQMTSLIIAQRAYEANAKVFESARDAYRRALQIGRS